MEPEDIPSLTTPARRQSAC